jgi:glyoxylase-like metal-dependent hydrolase (beta-lactamase superfamily II)
MTSKTYQIGDAQVTRVTEMVRSQAVPATLFPKYDDTFFQEHKDWLLRGSMTADGQFLMTSMHTWIVRTGKHTILIDTACGNGKERPQYPMFHRLHNPYLERLKEAGVSPEQVDFVLLTHLHADHVGWNTRLESGRWVSTFPNAKFVFSKSEYEFYADPEHVQPLSAAVFEESVQPVIDSGQAIMIAAEGSEFIDGLAFHRTAGHSYDHASISLSSKGQEALFAGDIMHHPLQVYQPDWNSMYCEFQDQAKESRSWVLDYVVDRQATYFSSHFPDNSAGTVTRKGEDFGWNYV